MMYQMVYLESARPAIRKGKAVMDAARNNFPNNRSIKLYLEVVYDKIDDKKYILKVLNQAKQAKGHNLAGE